MRPIRVAYLGIGFGFACAASLLATTYTVTTTADAGAGSLRQALTDASGAAGPHTIAFNIPGTGPHTIALASDLPNVNVDAGLTIDGTTQPGFAGTPQIEIHHDGTFSSQCLRFVLTPVTIKALAINRCGTAINSTSGGSLTLLGSRLGTDPSGTVALGNAIGVSLSNGSAANVIGGPNPADRNILSAHTSNAIQFTANSGGTVRGNSIGVDATGTVALGNFIGVNCSSSNVAVIVGGGGAGQGNIISGNTEKGILLQTCQNAVVQGNLIGTDVTGTLPIPNNEGIEANGSPNLEIGGTGAGEGNVIAASVEQAIRLGSAGAIVQGNFIGTDESGTAALGNGTGIEIPFGTTTLVGPDTPGGPGANVIAFNILGMVDKGASTTVRGNSIHDNKFLGLDTGTPFVNANDAGDADNGQPNFPNVTSAVVEGAGVRIIGILESNPSSSFDLDFYSNPACSRFPQDYFEGETWIGTTPVTTDGSGHAAFNVLLSPVTVPPGFRLSATSTTSGGSTSEFSQQIVLSSAGLTGNTGGGSVLNIGGMQFENGATVAVGGVPATNVQWLGPTNITAIAPALPAGSINAVTVTNPSGLSGTLPNAYVSSFADGDIIGFRPFIGGLVANGLTVGCGGPNYCPLNPVTRQQMAVFLLRGKNGLCYTPPPCTGTVFDDVPCTGNGFDPWIEALAGLNITGGCAGGANFCPTDPVNRQQMAVFLLKALEGSGYVPPACAAETFTDVPCSNPFSSWIYELAQRQITGGCGGDAYCPATAANRQQMAVFLVKTFALPY